MTKQFEFTNGFLTKVDTVSGMPPNKKLYTFENGILVNVQETNLTKVGGRQFSFENGVLIAAPFISGSTTGSFPGIPYKTNPYTINTASNIVIGKNSQTYNHSPFRFLAHGKSGKYAFAASQSPTYDIYRLNYSIAKIMIYSRV